MTVGNLIYNRGPLPQKSLAPAYDVPANEQDLSRFTMDAWMQPDQGNYLAPAPNLHIFSRVNGYDIRASGPDISVGTALSGDLPAVRFPGGATPGHTPLTVEGLKLGGHYTIAMIVELDSTANMATTSTFARAGIKDTASNLRIFHLNGALRIRHGTAGNDHVSVAEFSAGDVALLLSTYDADADEVQAYINSQTPVVWESTDATGAVGGDGDVAFGGEYDTGTRSAIQMLDGAVRFAMVNREPWGRAEYNDIRQDFIARMAAIYADDITLV